MNNTVELLGFYGSDTEHAQSAWTSTNRELTPDKAERIPALLNMLAKEGHHTPFEKSQLHFLVNTDIATHIHLLKHRVGVSINAESARYKELKEDKNYLPEDWRGTVPSNPVVFECVELRKDSGADWFDILDNAADMMNFLYHEAIKDLTPTLGRKRAKESARFFKTYNSQIAADISFNWRSFMHFQKLRNDEHAQVEVREVAQQMLDLVRNLPGNPFKYSLQAFNY